jgi:AcrR family transcriptional regulator
VRRTKADALITRETLLDAAQTVFLREGVRHTSMADIAAAASMTRGAIYWHFTDKDDLLKALQERVKLPQEFFASLDDPDGPHCPLARLMDAGLAVMSHLRESDRARIMCSILTLQWEAPEGMENSCGRIDRADDRMKASIRSQFERAATAGILAEGWTAEEAALLYRCSIGGIVKDWLKGGSSYDPTEVFRISVDALFDALVRPRDKPRWAQVAQITAVPDVTTSSTMATIQ